MQVEELNKQTALGRVNYTYPYILVMDPGDPIALVVPSLEKGELPVLCDVDNVTYKVGEISRSALTISKLLRVTRLKYYKSKDTCVTINTAEDILRVMKE